ncbi:phosphatase PAP2 family protein [Pedobacter sp. AW1-32]|uniref:phosphatase PAP2 family protein n=1 Tax=Pedobacter sp. AW1-32 TaxID=3383026 RepID=UPI003FEE5E26
MFNKTESFVLLNAYHPKFLDSAFKGITFLGDGTGTLLLIAAFILAKKKKKAMTLTLAYAYSGILCQVLKQFFHSPRPKYFFEQTAFQYNHFVDGVNLYNHNSFPSGHTATIFALSTVLVLVFKKNKISIPCVILALLVGYSRIYLAQHFLVDVVAGATLGVSCALISYRQVYIQKMFRSAKVSKRYKRFMKLRAKNAVSLG